MKQEQYQDCEICGERYHGNDIATHMKDVIIDGEAVPVCKHHTVLTAEKGE